MWEIQDLTKHYDESLKCIIYLGLKINTKNYWPINMYNMGIWAAISVLLDAPYLAKIFWTKLEISMGQAPFYIRFQ